MVGVRADSSMVDHKLCCSASVLGRDVVYALGDLAIQRAELGHTNASIYLEDAHRESITFTNTCIDKNPYSPYR
jgi:hypothetical protein